jgi:hypothetical protein
VCVTGTLNTVRLRLSLLHPTNLFAVVHITLAVINVKLVAMDLCRKNGDPTEKMLSLNVNHVNGLSCFFK